jgi:hypothetical protein
MSELHRTFLLIIEMNVTFAPLMSESDSVCYDVS